MYDIQGKKVLEKEIQNPHLIEPVSLVGLTKGVYLAVLETATKKVTKRIIVE